MSAYKATGSVMANNSVHREKMNRIAVRNKWEHIFAYFINVILVALTDMRDVTLGVDSRPVLSTDGFVSFFHNGTWEIVCGHWNTTEGAQYATQICIYLGFHDYKNFYKVSVPNKSLTVIQNGKLFVSSETAVPSTKCNGIKVGCADTIDISHETNFVLKQSFDHFEFIPWNAEIYINGKYECSGALLEKNWVVTTKTCFRSNFR